MANAGEQTIDLVNKAGGTAVYTRVDVTKADEVEAMAAFAVDTYGKINVLFNNAGINNPSDDFLIADLSEEVWEEKISINLKGDVSLLQVCDSEVVTSRWRIDHK